ncbi:uncharacterized protein LOC107421278 isoform X2 [Ziziphus jujuba]|uniref:Uncharacterized protein LOC107421278 isoform X2 n=1 Tax=Ziziphus jujuba TaxID=326968 RepID=A0A6P3ZZ23_ZIZJJ|nr:uncharacterized protein LOC107421278 isoform X2 [Ziziphus jujuba]
MKHLANGKNNANKEGGEKVSANQVGGDVKPADVIWVKIHKDSWWPAQVVDENSISACNKPCSRAAGQVLVRLYGSYTYLYVDPIKSLSEFNIILKQNDGCYRAIFLKALEQVNSHSRRRTNTVIPQTEVKEKKILLRKAKEENNKASKKGGVKLDSENAKKEMNAKIETAKSSKQGGVPKKHQVRTSDAQAKGRNRASKLDGVQKKRKLDDLGVTEKSTSKTSGKTLVKNSKQDEVHKNVEQNSSRTVKSRRQKNIQDDVLKEPKSNDSSIVDNLRKRTAKHGKVPKKHREETSFAESQERSARRLKVMQNLGLVAPFGSPFVKNGHVAPSSA